MKHFLFILSLVFITAVASSDTVVTNPETTAVEQQLGVSDAPASNGKDIAADVDTVTAVIKDAVDTAPQKGSPFNQWWVWASGVALAAFGVFSYFKKKYKKK